MEEIWKDIPEYEGLYQVSNLGNIKSLPKEWFTGFGFKKHNGMILKATKSSNGYYGVRLSKNSIIKTHLIHKLVAMAFLNHKPSGFKLVIDHINDDKLDNQVENLQIVTQRFNTYKTQGKYSSKYKGVAWNRFINKWMAYIKLNGKNKHLGFFDCELKAHQAYQDALKSL
jgi:hypothetical protein